MFSISSIAGGAGLTPGGAWFCSRRFKSSLGEPMAAWGGTGDKYGVVRLNILCCPMAGVIVCQVTLMQTWSCFVPLRYDPERTLFPGGLMQPQCPSVWHLQLCTTLQRTWGPESSLLSVLNQVTYLLCYWLGHIPSVTSRSGSPDFFHKERDGKYFRLWMPYHLFGNYFILPL